MKILIYGAGVLGSLYAARLDEAGHDVTLLARGTRLAQLRHEGIVLTDASSGKQSVTHVSLIERLLPDDPYDLIAVIMRRNQVAEILPALAESRCTPNVLFMTNNAAGPDEYVAALGPERVLLGFPGAGGVRKDGAVRYLMAPSQPTSIGELDGSETQRIQDIAQALCSAGFPVTVRPNMDAWLKTHVALVSPIANALYATNGDIYRLARTRDALVLLIRAVREGFRVLDDLCIPITPARLRVLQWIPEPVLVAVLQHRLPTEQAELALAGHANAARDEMRLLADEFQALARRSGLPTPALDRLHRFSDPARAPFADGSARLSQDWRGLVAAAGALLTLLLLLLPPRRR